MAKYAENDCRNNAARIKNPVAVSQAQFIIETKQMNRHYRRKEKGSYRPQKYRRRSAWVQS